MKYFKATEDHNAFTDALLKAMTDHSATVSDTEMLAIMSQLVGQMIAHQDATRFTDRQIFELVQTNIEQGNVNAIAQMKKESGGLQ